MDNPCCHHWRTSLRPEYGCEGDFSKDEQTKSLFIKKFNMGLRELLRTNVVNKTIPHIFHSSSAGCAFMQTDSPSHQRETYCAENLIRIPIELQRKWWKH
jgi:hypothetical protein